MFENILEDIQGKPSFERFPLRDDNPVSGRIKTRMVANPNTSMRTIHRNILHILDGNWITFYHERSPHGNAVRHAGNRYFYQTDIRHAYQDVPLEDLSNTIATTCREDIETVREVLSAYCFEGERGLIVGAPASPRLFNIYASEFLDKPIQKLWPDCAKDTGEPLGKVYTRYLDDLTFSSPNPISSDLRKMVRDVITKAGFEVNHRKSTLLDLAKGPVVITGVGLAFNPYGHARTFLPRHYLRRMKGMLHLALKGDPRIDRDEVEGLMGVFHAVFGRKHKSARQMFKLNNTETKILELYRKYQARYPHKRR